MIKNRIAWSCFVLCVNVALLLFSATAFAEKHDKPDSAAKPNEEAVAKAKSQQVLSFKMGEKNLSGCLVCHFDSNLYKKENGVKRSLFVDAKKFGDSVHAEVGCVGCHVGWGLQAHKPPMTDNWRSVAKMACKDCHEQQYKLYSESKHYKAYKEGKKKAPTCFDCHGNHFIVKAKAKDSPVHKKNAPKEVCGKCHKHEKKTYLKNYHGQTLVALGYSKSASCANCHKSHNITNLKNEADAEKACKQCHSKATGRLAKIFEIHSSYEDFAKYPVLSILELAMHALLVAVFGIFWTLTGLLLYRKRKELRAKKNNVKED